MAMTNEDVGTAIGGLLVQGATMEQISGALLANGATQQQIVDGMDQANFETNWNNRLAAATAQYPAVTTDHTAALKYYIDQGFGFGQEDLPRCAKKMYAILANNDVETMVPAMSIMLATIYKINPSYKQG